MATTDVPNLPPPSPRSPFATDAQIPHSARVGTPSRRSAPPLKRNTPSRLLSPSKGRTSLSRSPRKSPARSPVRNTKSVSFTPVRTKQPPRAWERRPATPFVPRDEKQRIWKRVPLGDLGVDINQPTGVSRREREAGKDYTRVVKKLKISHDAAGEGASEEEKENVVMGVSSKAEFEGSELKRRTVSVAERNFVSMKMVEDEILGSPKKKLRRPLVEEDVDGEELEIQDEDATENEDLSGEESREEVPGSHELPHVEAGDGDDIVSEHDSTPTVAQYVTLMDTDTASQPAEGTEERSASAPAVVTQAEREVFEEGVNSPVPTHHEAAAEAGVASVEAEPSLEADQEHRLAGDEALSPAQDVTTNQELEDKRVEELGSSSPPTILAEHVVIDELAVKQSPTPTRSQDAVDAETKKDQEAEDAMEAAEVQPAVPRRISFDETAFLRDFMSRTKAERAAREQAREQMADEETTMEQLEEEEKRRMDETTARLSSSPPKLESTEQQQTAPTSPLRRSKRAVVTSIPRPQGIINSIQLKRANGNEFIFTANKASSAANVALVTRSNTKKNKGSAMNVPERLELLTAEKDSEQSGQAGQAQNGEAAVEVIGEKASKKRKRDKNDTGKKAKKVLRWNEERLVEYQEAEKISGDDWEDIEDSSQDSMRQGDREKDEPSKHVKLTLTVSEPGHADGAEEIVDPQVEPEQKDQKHAASSQSKSGRVRRGISGTVNGTPAPKTRSHKIDLDESTIEIRPEVEASAEPSAAAEAAISTLAAEQAPKPATTAAARKSRMPVPSSARRGAAASASARTAASSLPSKAGGSGPETKEGARPAQQKESEKSDLLGKRRLRVRS